jgi:hypothetical protein
VTISGNSAESIRILKRTIPLPPDFEASWAGGCPWGPGYYCFGSDDGRVRFIGLNGVTEISTYAVSPSEEAVNGIAFAGDLMAVSTRSDVTFLNVPFLGEGHVERAVFNGGAHGVSGTNGGSIVAPMGRRGILLMSPKHTKAETVRILEPADESLYAYKVVTLNSLDRGEILACAGRRGGFAAMPLAGAGLANFGKRLCPAGVDFVDVAALGVDGFPFAVAALGLDCSIHLVLDVLGDRTSKRLHFSPNGERAYRLLCAKGHVFVLTDKSLYTFFDLAAQFVQGEAINAPPRRWPLEAVDASSAFDRSLLITMPDRVDQIELDSFLSRGDSQAGQPQNDSQIEVSEGTPLESASDEALEPGETPRWEPSAEFELAHVG